MAKEAAEEAPKKKGEEEVEDPEEELFKSYGIEDEDDKKNIRRLACARDLANLRIAKRSTPPAKEKKKSKAWGEE